MMSSMNRKAQAIFGTSDIRPAHDEELPEITGAHGGSIGPINLKTEDHKFMQTNLSKRC